MTPYYEKDGITIYHGDCIDVLPTLRCDRVAATITDPPYGINTKSDGTGKINPEKGVDSGFAGVLDFALRSDK